jgi:DNA-binding HxlR family transcriptional regulator
MGVSKMASRANDKQSSDSSKELPQGQVKSSTTLAALEELDRVFHEKARLGIMTTMVGASDGLNFNELKQLCDLTDGNLNRHLKVLVDVGVLSVKKTGQGRKTNSMYRMTAKGRDAFEKYLSALETVLRAAQQSRSSAVQDSHKVETGKSSSKLTRGLTS